MVEETLFLLIVYSINIFSILVGCQFKQTLFGHQRKKERARDGSLKFSFMFENILSLQKAHLPIQVLEPSCLTYALLSATD